MDSTLASRDVDRGPDEKSRSGIIVVGTIRFGGHVLPDTEIRKTWMMRGQISITDISGRSFIIDLNLESEVLGIIDYM